MILLLSCYELGHPPHGVAVARAFLERAGETVEVRDLAIDRLDEDQVRRARAIAVSVPMHTAARLGLRALDRIRAIAPRTPVGFYGHYAVLCGDELAARGAAFAIGGECEDELAAALACREVPVVALDRLQFPTPVRDGLPPLRRYAQLAVGDERRLAGYTETSRGCKHMCRHCPIPAVYGGRLFVVDAATVLADVEQQVAAGARHLTFGDADFLNGPRHALGIARAMHERWPELSFDATIKVSHLLDHAELLPELVELGCAFVVTAVESLNDQVLGKLRKGHTRADIERVLALARAAGLTLRPTFVPFTPWTELGDLGELVDFLGREQLVDAVDPIQLTIRLLVPPGSLLLDEPCFGPLDRELLSHTWAHEDPRVDALQRELAVAAERGAGFDALHAIIHAALGREAPDRRPRAASSTARLTESWFC